MYEWIDDDSLLIEPLETKFNYIWIKIRTFSKKKMRLKMSSAKLHPFGLGLNVLIRFCNVTHSRDNPFPRQYNLILRIEASAFSWIL